MIIVSIHIKFSLFLHLPHYVVAVEQAIDGSSERLIHTIIARPSRVISARDVGDKPRASQHAGHQPPTFCFGLGISGQHLGDKPVQPPAARHQALAPVEGASRLRERREHSQALFPVVGELE